MVVAPAHLALEVRGRGALRIDDAFDGLLEVVGVGGGLDEFALGLLRLLGTFVFAAAFLLVIGEDVLLDLLDGAQLLGEAVVELDV